MRQADDQIKIIFCITSSRSFSCYFYLRFKRSAITRTIPHSDADADAESVKDVSSLCIAINFIMFLNNYRCIILDYTLVSQYLDLLHDLLGYHLFPMHI